MVIGQRNSMIKRSVIGFHFLFSHTEMLGFGSVRSSYLWQPVLIWWTIRFTYLSPFGQIKYSVLDRFEVQQLFAEQVDKSLLISFWDVVEILTLSIFSEQSL